MEFFSRLEPRAGVILIFYHIIYTLILFLYLLYRIWTDRMSMIKSISF